MSSSENASKAESEGELVERAKQGQRDAITELFERHLPTVHRYALRMCRDPEKARDVAQDSLLGALQSLGTFRADASFSTWLFTIARSQCGKTRRRAQRENSGPPAETGWQQLASSDPQPETASEHAQLSRIVERELDQLAQLDREVLVLRDVEGVPATEAAKIMDMSVGALKSRLHRARTQLRDKVELALGQPPIPLSPDCPDIVAALSQKSEGDLAQSACARLEQHVAHCPQCSAKCDSIRELLGACKRLGHAKADPALATAIHAWITNSAGTNEK